MTIMVPDLVQPGRDISGLCECIVADLHVVRELILNSLIDLVGWAADS
jgi:hypothetical protein